MGRRVRAPGVAGWGCGGYACAMSDDPARALRELEASGQATAEEIREEIVRAIWRLDAAEREALATDFEKAGRTDLAEQIRRVAAGALNLGKPQ